MKHAAVILSAAALVSAAKPTFLNSDYSVVEGEPFTLTFEGCEDGCTITLEQGPEDQQEPVQELTTNATGGEATITLEDLPSNDYAFRITDNDSGEYNFSPQFPYEGTGEAPETTTTEEATTTTEAPETTTTSEEETTTTEEETSTTEEETTTTEEETTTTEEPTTTPSSSITTTTSSEASTTTEAEETTTNEADETEPTEVPDGEDAAGSLNRPMALVFGAVVAMLLLN